MGSDSLLLPLQNLLQIGPVPALDLEMRFPVHQKSKILVEVERCDDVRKQGLMQCPAELLPFLQLHPKTSSWSRSLPPLSFSWRRDAPQSILMRETDPSGQSAGPLVEFPLDSSSDHAGLCERTRRPHPRFIPIATDSPSRPGPRSALTRACSYYLFLFCPAYVCYLFVSVFLTVME
jgi:hypothetical protein